MRRLSALLVLLFFTYVAAQTFNTDVRARFKLPCKSSSPLYNLPAGDPSECKLNPISQATDWLSTTVQISWGVGVYPGLASSLLFEPYAGVLLGASQGQAKKIGKLTHLNYPVNCYDDCDKYLPQTFQLDLYMTVTLTGSNPLQTRNFQGIFNMNLVETPNTEGRSSSSQPCPYDPHEASWVFYLPPNGYSNSYPCCPYYTEPSAPGPDGSTYNIKGACSDRIRFATYQAPATINFNGVDYTVVIAGFSTDPNSFNSAINTFTSQENLSQFAYVYAYVVRKCTDASACNDGKSCTIDTCGSDGLCYNSYSTTNGQACTDAQPPNQPAYNSDLAACMKWKCLSGTCQGSAYNSGGTCPIPSESQPSGTTSDCVYTVCQSGLCKYARKNSGSCTVGPSKRDAQCQSKTCINGACTISDLSRSCTPNDANQASGLSRSGSCNRAICTSGSCRFSQQTGSCRSMAATACNRRICKTVTINGTPVGSCLGTAAPAGGSCVGNLSPLLCKKRTCIVNGAGVGSCVSSPLAGSCASGYTLQECKRRVCDGSGNCQQLDNDNQGSCTGQTLKACYKRSCSGGQCTRQLDSAQIQGSCKSITAVDCKRRLCDNQGSCVASIFPTVGSCKNAKTIKSCYRRICNTNTGTCEQKPNSAQGSCSTVATRDCRRRTCDSSGSCTLGLNVGASGQGSCTAITAVDCKRRTCDGEGSCVASIFPTAGSCKNAKTIKSCYRRICNTNTGTCEQKPNTAQGSCSTVATRDCRRRTCDSSGSCALGLNVGASGQGSCTAITAVECYRRSCDSQGSCVAGINPTAGSCKNARTTKSCYKRICNTATGSCQLLGNANQGSCSTIGAVDCYRRTCDATGSCSAKLNTGTGGQGSCTAVATRYCQARRCNSAGDCVYVNYATAVGSCQGQSDSTPLAALKCNRRQCTTTGSCRYIADTSVAAGSCSSSFPLADCQYRVCKSVSAYPPGSCGYSSVTSGSCFVGLSAIACNTRQCNSQSQCVRVYSGAGACSASVSSNDNSCYAQRCRNVGGLGTCSTSARVGRTCSGAGAAKVCAPQRCDSTANCIYRPDLMEGGTCLTAPDANAKKCITSNCNRGTCFDTSRVADFNASLVCKANDPSEDICRQYLCLYRSASNLNHMGTCVRQVDTTKVDQNCTRYNNPDSARDQRCYQLKCNSLGVCTQIDNPDGTYCDTPSNAIVENGYGCSQYVCKAGTCNTGVAVPITNGSACAGAVPCDPSQAGCLSECQRFACFNGHCQVDYNREGQNCTYIKYLTARDGSLEEVRATTSVTASECTLGKCTQGRCAAYVVNNGTACGNRTKYNDLCYNDYCDTLGRCVSTGRKNCAGTVPLPSVCWDVTCDAATGDCVLVTNGVVDCSCINDCSACTAVFDLTNRDKTNGRTLGCWWCTGNSKKGIAPGCYNRYLPGSSTEIQAPEGKGKCYKNSSPCGGGGGLSGGQIAGIVLGILGLTSLALLAIALAILLFRYCATAGSPPANASLTDLAFDKNVKNNCFYKGANLEMFSSVYAEPKFITT